MKGCSMTYYSVQLPEANEDLLRLFNKKCDRIDTRGKARGKAPIDREKLWNFFYEQLGNAFYCSYCGIELTIDSSDQERIFSFDHYVPLSKGGGNELSNLELVCNACNTVKGRLNAETFNRLIEVGGRGLIVQMFNDQKEARAPKVQSEFQCENCSHFTGSRCRVGLPLANDRDSDWCGRWNA